MPKNMLLLHANKKSTPPAWTDWLKNRLLWRGYDVEMPTLTDLDATHLDESVQLLLDTPLDATTTVVAHDLGAAIALALLQRSNVQIRSAFLIAPVVPSGSWRWQRLSKSARELQIWWSRDDPVVRGSHIDPLAAHLGIDPLIVEGHGHFDNDKQLPDLFDAIL